MFNSFDDVLRHLDGLGLFHMDMALTRMVHALTQLDALRLPCPVVQVVGTNGKGSTAAFLHALATAHGFRAGLYTSPHFLSPTERIRMVNRSLPEAAWPDLAQRALQAEPDLTYFELLTVMAILAFRDAEPDLLILEAGLGGRCDATSAVPADMICVTPIAMDHMHVLGPDLPTIAADKADAMRPGMFVAVSAPQKAEAQAALQAKATSLSLPLCIPPHDKHIPDSLLSPALRALLPLTDTAPLGLMGCHQRTNATTALTAWLLLCQRQQWHTDERLIQRGLHEAFLPGRLQSLPPHAGYPAFLLDGAHNTHGMEALCSALAKAQIQPSALIFSCLTDKHPEQLVPLVRTIAGNAPLFIPPVSSNPRAASTAQLAALFGPSAQIAPSLQSALDSARDYVLQNAPKQNGPILICGSLYLLAEFFSLFPHALCQRPQ